MKIKISVFLLFLSAFVFAQNGILKGVVKNGSGKTLAYATVQIKELHYKTYSNADGTFLFDKLPYGKYTLIISHIGYATKSKKIEITQNDTALFIVMSEKPITLGEAVIIGTKTPEEEKNFALPTENITERKLEAEVSNNIPEALQSKAGIDVARDGAWGAMINVRGLTKQNLVYLIDGARIETSTNIAGGLSLFDMNDIEKVEVIKSGFSSLYGSGATGGVVNIITKQARFSEFPYVQGKIFGAYQTVNAGQNLGLNLFAGAKKWKMKISASKRKCGDTKTPDGYLKNSGFTDYSYSASFGFTVGANLELKGEFQKYKAENVGIPGGSAFPPNATADYKNAERKLVSLGIIWRKPLSEINTLAINYYNQLIKRDVQIIPVPGKTVEPSSEHKTQGISLQGETVFGKHALIAGLEAWERKYNGKRITTNEIQNVITADKPLPDSKFASFGFFVNDNYYCCENLKINLGGRYDLIEISNEKTNNPLYKIIDGEIVYPPANPYASFNEGKEKNESWSANLNFIYSLATQTDLTISLAKTFRSPSLEERFQYINLGGIIYLGNPELKPEKSVSLNVGARYYGKFFSLKIDAFGNYFNDLVIDATKNADSLYVKQNVGEARFLGVDFSFQTKICKSLLSGTFSYVYARNVLENEPLPQIPPINGTVEITSPVTNVFEFTIRAKLYADKNDVPSTEKRTPGYAVYDFEIKSGKISLGTFTLNLYFGITNIFNRKYRNHLSTYRGISLTEPARNIFVKTYMTF